jgi:DNA (cytosine-5)-methyltransferase 1
MTLLPERIKSGEVEAPDLFCGGTPCQAFSVAGLRKSLDDDRGNLSLTFCEIADEIDTARSIQGREPCIVFWENVPGVLNTKDNAFGCFLAGLAGEELPLLPTGGKWTNAGCVFGPKRAIAWRILDAQYFGVAQRRRRVFVVASAREGFDPSKILFEFQGVRRDTAPSREARKEVTECAGTLTANGGGLNRPAGNANELDFCIATTFDRQSSGEYGTTPVASTVAARDYKSASDLVAFAIQGSMIGRSEKNGPQGDGVNTEICFTQNTTDRHAVAQPMPINTMIALRHNQLGERTGFGIGEEGDPSYTLTKGHSHAIAYAFDSLSSNSMKSRNPHSGVNAVDVSKTLDTSRGLDPSCNQGGIGIAQPLILEDQGGSVMNTRQDGTVGTLRRETHGHEPIVLQQTADCLTAAYGTKWNGNASAYNGSLFAVQPMAFAQNTRDEVRYVNGDGSIVGALAAEPGMKQTSYIQQPMAFDGYNQTVSETCQTIRADKCDGDHIGMVYQSMAVRRLTPVECERLQGFPDGYTDIKPKGKPTPDGPRYKALGNSWAVPVVRWIGKRIQEAIHERQLQQE